MSRSSRGRRRSRNRSGSLNLGGGSGSRCRRNWCFHLLYLLGSSRHGLSGGRNLDSRGVVCGLDRHERLRLLLKLISVTQTLGLSRLLLRSCVLRDLDRSSGGLDGLFHWLRFLLSELHECLRHNIAHVRNLWLLGWLSGSSRSGLFGGSSLLSREGSHLLSHGQLGGLGSREGSFSSDDRLLLWLNWSGGRNSGRCRSRSRSKNWRFDSDRSRS